MATKKIVLYTCTHTNTTTYMYTNEIHSYSNTCIEYTPKEKIWKIKEYYKFYNNVSKTYFAFFDTIL